jgi:parallel beta-helix repeat protein
MSNIFDNHIRATKCLDVYSGRYNIHHNELRYYEDGDWGIHVWGASGGSGNNIIDSNWLMCDYGIVLESSNNNTVSNNLIRSTLGHDGIKTTGAVNTMISGNDIINSGGGYAVNIDASSSTSIFNNRLYTTAVPAGTVSLTNADCTSIIGNDFFGAGKGIKNWGGSDKVVVAVNYFQGGNLASTYILGAGADWNVTCNFPSSSFP